MYKKFIKRFLFFTFIISLIVIIDQKLKLWVIENMFVEEKKSILKGIIDLYYQQNQGLIFGITFQYFKYWKLIFFIFKLFVLFMIIFYIFSINNRVKYHTQLFICGSFIVGGGIGNCIDWLFYGWHFGNKCALLCEDAPFTWCYGKVVDMISLPFMSFTFPESLPYMGGLIVSPPTFNIADIFIFLGSVLSVIILFINSIKTNTKLRYTKSRSRRTRKNK